MQCRGYGKNRHSGVHLFSGKIKCGQCGSWYGSKVWHSNSKYRKTIWQCNHKFNSDEHCQTSHLTDEDIQNCFLAAANKLLATKDSVVTDAQAMLSMFLDTTALEQEQDELLVETQVVSDLVQQCIYDNAHVALDQTEYNKRFNSLSLRFEKAKARLDTVMDEIQKRQAQRADIEAFIAAFQAMSQALTVFTPDAWLELVDFITVNSDKDIRVTFKNGQEIQA